MVASNENIFLSPFMQNFYQVSAHNSHLYSSPNDISKKFCNAFKFRQKKPFIILLKLLLKGKISILGDQICQVFLFCPFSLFVDIKI